MSRSAERLEPLVARGAEPAVGEPTDTAYLSRAFKGADAAYTMIPPNYADPDFAGFYERVGTATADAVWEQAPSPSSSPRRSD